MSQRASAAAIFIGCCSVISRAWRSPLTATPTTGHEDHDRPDLRRGPELGASSRSGWRSSCQIGDAGHERAARHEGGEDRVRERDQVGGVEQHRDDVGQLGPPGRPRSRCTPTGCCIHELAARMK